MSSATSRHIYCMKAALSRSFKGKLLTGTFLRSGSDFRNVMFSEADRRDQLQEATLPDLEGN